MFDRVSSPCDRSPNSPITTFPDTAIPTPSRFAIAFTPTPCVIGFTVSTPPALNPLFIVTPPLENCVPSTTTWPPWLCVILKSLLVFALITFPDTCHPPLNPTDPLGLSNSPDPALIRSIITALVNWVFPLTIPDDVIMTPFPTRIASLTFISPPTTNAWLPVWSPMTICFADNVSPLTRQFPLNIPSLILVVANTIALPVDTVMFPELRSPLVKYPFPVTCNISSGA